MSLAVVDFLTGIVVCGAVNSTYTLYFTPHVFNEKGEEITTLHYHTQTYIDGFGVITILSLSASILLLVVISMDR